MTRSFVNVLAATNPKKQSKDLQKTLLNFFTITAQSKASKMANKEKTLPTDTGEKVSVPKTTKKRDRPKIKPSQKRKRRGPDPEKDTGLVKADKKRATQFLEKARELDENVELHPTDV